MIPAAVLLLLTVLVDIIKVGGLPSIGNPRLGIVGGDAVIPNTLPYQISLKYYDSHVCGGAIYSESYVITAAHCVDGDPPTAFTIAAGDHSLAKTDGTEQIRAVKSTTLHENYVSYIYGSDIALLKLKEPLIFNDAVQSISPAPSSHTATGNGTISGWGSLTPGGPSPDVLHQVSVSIIPDADCRQQYGQDAITDDMLCAGDPNGGKDSCRGDSGGPLVASDLPLKYLAGIVSWGLSCALPNYPGVYTEVSYFTEWIEQNAT